MTSNTIKLSLEGKLNNASSEVVKIIENAVVNSISEIKNITHSSTDFLQLTIHTSSDKLENLCFRLAEMGLEFTENTQQVLRNAAEQYSMFRNIELNLNIKN